MQNNLLYSMNRIASYVFDIAADMLQEGPDDFTEELFLHSQAVLFWLQDLGFDKITDEWIIEA